MIVFLFASAGIAQQVDRSPFDISTYRMDVNLLTDQNRLNATVDVDFTPLADTRNCYV